MQSLGVFLCCLLFPLWSGCTHLRQLVGLVADKPEVSLRQIEVESFAIDRIRLVFILDIANPNDFSLDIADLDYRVRSLGMELGEGRIMKPLSLGAAQKSEVRLPFAVKPDMAFSLFKKYLARPKELKLQFDARLFIDTTFGKMDMHFLEERTVVRGLK